MPYIGDVYVPFVTEEGLSQSRDTATYSYPGGADMVQQFERELEAGDISVVLHQPSHPRSETLSEEREGIVSLLDRNAFNNPFNFYTERGYLAVSNVSVPRVAELNKRDGSISVSFMPSSAYQPGVEISPEVYPNDHSITKTGTIAVASNVEHLRERDKSTGSESAVTKWQTLSFENGNIDIYDANDAQYVYDYPDSNFVDSVQRGEIRAFDHNGSSTESDWHRVYDNRHRSSGFVVDNGFIRFVFNDPSDSNTHVYWYDGTSWVDAGTLDITARSINGRDYSQNRLSVRLSDGELVLYRGRPIGYLELEGRTSLTFDSGLGDNPLGTSTTTTSGATIYGHNPTAFDYALMKPSSDGSLAMNGDNLEATGLTNSQTYTLPFGVVDETWGDAATENRYLTDSRRVNHLIQRREL